MGMGEADSIFDYIVILILWGILSGPFVIALLLLLFAAVATLLSPVAALVSGVLAYRRGLNSFRYAAVGLLYSVMLGFPWLYLTFGMLNVSAPRIMARTLYFFTYGVWLFCIVIVFLFAIVDIGDGTFFLVAGLLLICHTVINGVLWVYSLSKLLHNNVSGGEFSEEKLFPYLWNVLPFACLFFFVVLPLILWWLTTQGSLSELVQETIVFFRDDVF